MSMAAELVDMLAICEARYAQTQQDFAKLVAEENRLRAELTRLDTMNQAVAPPADMQAIGADVIWRAWLGRTKTALNIKLAQVLSLKESHMAKVRHAYGKVLVVQEMQSTEKAKSRKKSTDHALSQAIDFSIFK